MSTGEWIWLRVSAWIADDGSVRLGVYGEEAEQEFLLDVEYRIEDKTTCRVGVKR